jgi:hypothetical protein
VARESKSSSQGEASFASDCTTSTAVREILNTSSIEATCHPDSEYQPQRGQQAVAREKNLSLDANIVRSLDQGSITATLAALRGLVCTVPLYLCTTLQYFFLPCQSKVYYRSPAPLLANLDGVTFLSMLQEWILPAPLRASSPSSSFHLTSSSTSLEQPVRPKSGGGFAKRFSLVTSSSYKATTPRPER